MRKVILTLLFVLLLGISSSLAESNVQIFFVACENQAVINLSGTIDAGYDVYYQVFAGAGGTGTALTGVRRASLDGTVAFSDQVAYNSGATIAAGAVGSVHVVVGREDDASRSTLDTTVDDVQDGCANPQNPLGTSQDINAPATTTTVDLGPQVVSPFGGFLNPNLEVTAEPIVVIGARPHPEFRSSTPGLIFAECTEAPRAIPGVIYDNDNVVIFWSWYAKTQQEVQDHINNANYAVTLNRQPFVNVVVSPIEKRGPNFFVFYTTQIGNLRPGSYGTQLRLNWNQPITDGYADYGPGTTNEVDSGDCHFDVRRNLANENVLYNLMYSLPG